MAKLYAELYSDKNNKTVSKGGNDSITTRFYNGTIPVFEVTMKDDGERRGTLAYMSYTDGVVRLIEYSEPETTKELK